MKCLCGNIVEIDYDFKNSCHIAQCIFCGNEISDKSYFSLIKKLQKIDIESTIKQYDNKLKLQKEIEINKSFLELSNRTLLSYIDELDADTLIDAWLNSEYDITC